MLYTIIFFFFFRLPYFETSAATGQNVSKVINTLLDMVMVSMEQAIDKGGALPGTKGTTKVNSQELDEAGDSGCAC